MHTALDFPLIAQVGYAADWAGFWIILAILAGALGAILVLFFRSQPPLGPKVGE
ncbi:Hypothetical protein A7982_05256 [Minicystis rosea]|nr:Hypothetical protein A7982_05256 [Minicystis rosea]